MKMIDLKLKATCIYLAGDLKFNGIQNLAYDEHKCQSMTAHLGPANVWRGIHLYFNHHGKFVSCFLVSMNKVNTSRMKTVGIGIVIWKTVAVGTRFFRIYETNKIKYGENDYKINWKW